MLSDQIISTIKYFDIQDHCLTLLEVNKYLLAPTVSGSAAEQYREYKVSEVLYCLENDLAGSVSCLHGFYFLRGREFLADRRLKQNFYATPRLKRAKKYLPMARHIPFISAIALTGSEAINNSKQGSDIDLLVLTRPGRIWLGRLFLTAYFQILGVRRHGMRVADRFCLNHYIEQGKTLNADQNIYTAIEYVSLVPYYGAAEVFEFQRKNLPWIQKYLVQPQLVDYSWDGAAPRSAWKKFWESVLGGAFGNVLEKFAGSLQRSRIEVGEYIVVAEDELSFHPGSKGQQVLAKINFSGRF